jgi:uncharacterized Zn-binding protein involved in type VI secretion
MDQEPHHHMVMENAFFKVFNVVVAPGDAIVLHRHDHDTVAIAIGDQEVTVGVPGKPDVHQKNLDGQVRLQPGGYMHSTHVDGAEPYHTVAVELLQPQTGGHNLCATVMAGQPLNCPASSARASSAGYSDTPQFESNQTRISLIHVFPHRSAPITSSRGLRLIVALDAGVIWHGDSGMSIDPGAWMWIDKEAPGRGFENKSGKDARFIELSFKSSPKAK